MSAAVAAAGAGSSGSTSNAMLGSAGISGASGIIGGFISGIQQRKARNWQEGMIKSQRQFESTEAEKAYQRQIELWNMENEYNTPANIVKRMMEAGINPNSIVEGQTVNAAMTPSSVGRASAPSAPSPYTADIGSLVSGSISSMANNMLLLNQAEKTKKEANWIDTEKKATVDNIKAATDKTLKDKEVSHEQANLLRKTVNMYDGLTTAQIESINASAALAKQQIFESEAKIKNLDEDTRSKVFENSINAVMSELARKYQIVVSKDGLTALVTLLMSDNGADLVNTMASNLGTMIGAVPVALANALDSTVESFKKTGGNIVRKGKNMLNKALHFLGFD